MVDGKRHWVLDRGSDGLRLDEVLARLIPDLSRARLQKLVRRGHVRLDGRAVLRSNGRVRAGTRVEVEGNEAAPAARTPELTLLDEDDDLLVVDKPAGLLTHRAEGARELSVAELADAHFGPLPTNSGARRPGVVHRLDKDTSGVLVLARNADALRALKRQFRERTVAKRYLALCAGEPHSERWSVDRPLGPDPRGGPRRWVDPPEGGQPALTRFRVLDRIGPFVWVEACPETGRRHQVRVHLCASGLPIVDDPLYGEAAAGSARVGRCALHAAELELEHPGTRSRTRWKSPLPVDLAEGLRRLR